MTAACPDRSLPLMSALSGFLRELKKPAHLLVAISGGSDSTGLLVGLSSLRSCLPDIRLSATTIDHALRPEAADEARAVAKLCADLGIFHVTRRWETEKPVSGISAAAREARYSLLSDVADEIGATAIVTGHTLGDQIETVTMRSGRGEANNGSQPFSLGLSGMAPATLLNARHWILRPLLHTSRNDIRAFLTHHGFGWIDDPSNLDRHYERVRVRETLIAREAAFDADAIADAGQVRMQLAQDAADWLAAHATIEHAVLARISVTGLSGEPAVIRHALSTLAAVLGGRPYMLSRENGDRLMTFIASGTLGRMTAGRVIFDSRSEALYMLRENRNLPHLTVGVGEGAIWDSRFRIENHSAQPMEVTVQQNEAVVFESAPGSLARLAVRVSPHVANQPAVSVSVTPYLAPFDRFLPAFDLPIASRIAGLMGRNPYLLPPV